MRLSAPAGIVGDMSSSQQPGLQQPAQLPAEELAAEREEMISGLIEQLDAIDAIREQAAAQSSAQESGSSVP